MCRVTNKFICIVIIVLCITQPITPKRGFSSGRHSYPKSGGLSGGGGSHHTYPSSGGLSGGSHGYPSSGGSHGYPSSGGLSGNSHSRPSGGSYPTNTQSSSHSYPSGKGLSGNSHSNTGSHTTNIHYHYSYNPPQQIRYTPVHGGPPVSYPVYHGTPPTYIYKYQDSGSKYGTLLTGLALLNLGTLAGTAYALNKGHSNNYKPQPGEVCKFAIKKDNGDYDETRIDCEIISSFIYQEEAKTVNNPQNVTVVTTTVTNVTTVNSTPNNDTSHTPVGPTLYEMFPNGTLVPRNETTANTTTANNVTDNTVSSVMITTTNTTTVTNALDVKGKPVNVTPGMKCFVMRHTPYTNMRKSVPCGLLQTYATTSLKRSSATRNVPYIPILMVIVSMII